jgi:hypothetical protein
MSKAEVATLIEETKKQLAHYLEELEAGRPFDMKGFEQIALRIQKEIATLTPPDAKTFEQDIAALMQMLDALFDGLQQKRDTVRREIEGLNRQVDANKAYKKTDSNQ